MTTRLGDDRSATSVTGAAKSRRDLLEIPRAGRDDDVVNDDARASMRDHGLAGPVVDRLAAHPRRRFADRASWWAHPEALPASPRSR